MTINGIEYSVGSCGTLHLSCPNCGRDRFRQKITKIEWETCLDCNTQLELVQVDEIESKWLHIWNNLIFN